MRRALVLVGKALTTVLPWPLRRRCLNRFFAFSISPSARIGLSWVFPERLSMAEGSKIGHMVIAVHLRSMHLGPYASIGRGNWITGYPLGGTRHFLHIKNRKSELILGAHAAITKHHHFDCTHQIVIGAFTTIAGYRSQFLTHSIDTEAGRQDAHPINIGEYCFIGTACVVLGGARLPSRCVLGAKSLLNKPFKEEGLLFGGSPAKRLKALGNGKYFHRTTGFVE